MTVDELTRALQQETTGRAYIRRLEILEQSLSMVKARLVITPQLFVQVYRNDRFDTTNFALIHNDKRMYARDQLGGRWHRHPVNRPEIHDHGDEGRQTVSLAEFLNEVEAILADQNLP